MSQPVMVIGGGFAGLAAAVALAEKGQRVRLLEQKPFLGGRARSFVEPATGCIVDNGQHLLMGCYRATRRFLDTVGASDRFEFQRALKLRFLDTSGRATEMRCRAWRAPWHLIAGVILSNAFTWREKRELARFARALASRSREARPCEEHLTVSQWLDRMGQSKKLQRNFWDLLSIAAMNEDPEIASAAIFERVLKLALFSSPDDSRLVTPRAGLSECYTQSAADYIRARGGIIEFNRNVRRIVIERGECRGIEFADGTLFEGDTVISAVPWHVLVVLLPTDVLREDPFFTRILALRPAPIISINLWFDPPLPAGDFAGLRGTTIQWVFHREWNGSKGHPYLSVVLSGARAHVGKSKDELLAMALRDLERVLPETRRSMLRHSLIIKERFATFSPFVGVEALRPPARTPVRGLFLAGDWTATGLPSTIEGAVQSGYTAVGELMRDD